MWWEISKQFFFKKNTWIQDTVSGFGSQPWLWTEIKGWFFFKSELNTKSWIRKWQPTSVFLPGESHGQRSLADYSPWGRNSRTRLSDMLAKSSRNVHINTDCWFSRWRRNKGSKAPLARTFWEKLFQGPFLFPVWSRIITACPVHTEGQETAKPPRIAQTQDKSEEYRKLAGMKK